MKRAVKIIMILLFAAALVPTAFLGYYFSVTAGEKLHAEKLTLAQSCVQFYDKDGREIENPSQIRESVPLSSLPSHVCNAFVAVEDKNFYRHNGFNYKRIAKAFLKNIATFSFREGASTISQQLIKNTHLSGEKTINRKLKEFKLTRILEKNYSKEEILELYLNTIYFGHDSFGIADAARFYFGKKAEELTPAESAMLAALVKSPNRYSPFKNTEKCLERRNFVLRLMREQNYITCDEQEEAENTPLPTAPSKEKKGNSYLSLVFDELTELFPDYEAGQLSGLRVYTYLDPTLQAELEKTEAESDATILVRDNRSDCVKAFHSTAGLLTRLPASTIKPLLVYAPALQENAISPATPILDEKTNFGGYSPSNYGGTFGGYMSARYALSHSVNVPAVKLLNTLGCSKAVSYLEKMNLHVEKDDYTLSLALGGMKEGFTLTSLADAYSTFAEGGTFARSSFISRVDNKKGKTIYQFRPIKTPVFSDDVCFLLNDMLQTAVREGTAKKLSSLPFSVCAKTGTGANANGNVDAYTIAYTTRDTVAVWLGNRDNSPITATGGGAPAAIALNALRTLYRNEQPEEFPACDGVVSVDIDREEYETNHRILRADPAAPLYTNLTELFRANAIPESVSARFSRPSIENPKISVINNAVCIELCQTKYYDYIVKRENGGKTATVYSGKYRQKIFDNSVKAGQSYTYTVIPVYQGVEGIPITLPSVFVKSNANLPEEWWD